MAKNNEFNYEFIEGNTYKTRFQTGEKFLLTKIIWKPESKDKLGVIVLIK